MAIYIGIRLFPLMFFLYHVFMAAKQWRDDHESGEMAWFFVPGTNFSCAYWQWHACVALINLTFVVSVSLASPRDWELS